jgi:PAS domain S-box-containing protein
VSHAFPDDDLAILEPPAAPVSPAPELFFGGGQMGERTRAFDWSATPLGPPEDWPPSLVAAVNLILNAALPTYLAWGPQLIGFYNDAYLDVVADAGAGLGKPFRDAWAGGWHRLEPVVASTLAGQTHLFRNVPLTLMRPGYPEQTYWTITYGPVHDERGRIVGVQSTFLEMTGDVIARATLTAEREEVRRLFEHAPSAMAFSRGPDHVVELANEAFLKVVGKTSEELLGRPALEVLPEIQRQGYLQILDTVYRTGEPIVAKSAPVQFGDGVERPLEHRLFDLLFQPLKDHEGRTRGIFVDGVDITERERAAEQQALLINELNHRVKNTLATVQSMVAQTSAGAQSVPQFREQLEGRLLTLSSAHDILTRENWAGAGMREVVRRALKPFGGERSGRFEVSGPEVRLTPRQALALAMALHELATNATKYGSLSADAGGVRLAWALEAAAAPRLSVTWVEAGGPSPSPPKDRGFGTRLLERGLARELHGAVELRFAPSGVECHIGFPLAAD